ncbi:MAG: aspartyl-tRNA(Asn)/glutamyl-tRNA(Gln) amidotransferase subunit [Gaiellales bacterium]|nr:aspartyl-tRNA(Asn)/glutamyl-tRNA(Gln) amidotransferase subunit [Gaiellales bacterium]
MSAHDAVRTTLARIEAIEPSLHSYITVTADEALRAAKAFDAGTGGGPLRGMCVSVKDNIATAGVRTTAGSLLLEGNVPAESAPVVMSLQRAGAVVIGKAHMNELAFGGQQPAFGLTQNPWDPEVTPGGSSSGSAAGVAAGLATASIATDTAGSVRQPAAFCGVTGFKPTAGAISTEGVIPLSFTLDHIGIVARSAADASRVFAAVRRDGAEPTTATSPLVCLQVRAPKSAEPVAPEVALAVEGVTAVLGELGLDVRPSVVLRELEAGLAAMTVITRVEAALCHWPLVEPRIDEVHPAVRARLRMGRALHSMHYARALRARGRLAARVDALFDDADVLLMPAVPFAPPPAGRRVITDERGPRSVSTASCTFLALFNVTGHPAIVVPAGFTDAGLPLSVQLVGRRHEDDRLLSLAAAYQGVTDWHSPLPPIARPAGASTPPDPADPT